MAEKGTIEPLVSVAWLKEQLEQNTRELVVLDCSYDANKDECRDVTSPYPNMIPPPQVFAQYCGSIGLDNTMHVVLYDNNSRGLFSAPRAYWMFKAFGHDKVSILNGGLVTWLQNGFPTSSDIVQRPTKIFHATMKKEYLKTYDGMSACVLFFAASILGKKPPEITVYNGSWTEWGRVRRDTTD
ncbi:putative Thiosulfate sulfurtransferase [Hypsibius exemplaris]|uniref:Thiosulfate sulfurtransferase n=1 Tax=Hypsibius exemplaris TaxID=2072580 RepID=A0A1W0W9K2_HYPEX|nr:putative Thiosulfate sulfurtransferase [Hypsibius exemplaris]